MPSLRRHGTVGTPSSITNPKSLSTSQKKRLRYAIAGLFWKFEAFDVKPAAMEGYARDSSFGRSGDGKQKGDEARRGGDERKEKQQGDKNKGDKNEVAEKPPERNPHMKPLTSQITLNVPVMRGKRSGAFGNEEESQESASDSDVGWATFAAGSEQEEKTEKDAPKKDKNVRQPLPDLFSSLGPGVGLVATLVSSGSERGRPCTSLEQKQETPAHGNPVIGSNTVTGISSASSSAFEFDVLHAFGSIDFGDEKQEFEVPSTEVLFADDRSYESASSSSDTASDTDAREGKKVYVDEFSEPHDTPSNMPFQGKANSRSFSNKSSPRRSMDDPDLAEWGAACRAFPWLADTRP